MHRPFAIAVILLVLACGAPQTLTAPTKGTEPIVTDVPKPTRTPKPTAVPRGYVSRALMGKDWPLTIDEGTIVCDRTAILIRDKAGHLYAVNGTARGQIGHFGWRDVKEITAPDPNRPGLLMSTQPIINQGLTMCR